MRCIRGVGERECKGEITIGDNLKQTEFLRKCSVKFLVRDSGEGVRERKLGWAEAEWALRYLRWLSDIQIGLK